MQRNLYKYILLFVILILTSFRSYYLIKTNEKGVYQETYQTKNGDAGHYLRIGKNISEFYSYSDNSSDIPTESATWRPPIWPVLLSVFYTISDSLWVHILFKNLFTITVILFAIWLLYKNNKLLKIPIWAVLIVLLEPSYVKYSLTFLTEDLVASMLLLLTVLYVIPKNHIFVFPTVCALTVLTHPITVFFILFIYSFNAYRLYNQNKKLFLISTFIFLFLCSLWPLRNNYQFKKGFFITSSQGAALSKAWNDSVYYNFNNVNGDLADEKLNLKYTNTNNVDGLSVIDKSLAYKKAMLSFLKQASISDILKIGSVKLKSNFNPFPEKRKSTFLDDISILFRLIYLFLMIQAIYLFFFKRHEINNFKRKTVEVVLCVILAQIVTSIFFYTGLRFNSVYSLTLLLAFLILNFENIRFLLSLKLSNYVK